jgi:hypothetical protein
MTSTVAANAVSSMDRIRKKSSDEAAVGIRISVVSIALKFTKIRVATQATPGISCPEPDAGAERIESTTLKIITNVLKQTGPRAPELCAPQAAVAIAFEQYGALRGIDI